MRGDVFADPIVSTFIPLPVLIMFRFMFSLGGMIFAVQPSWPLSLLPHE